MIRKRAPRFRRRRAGLTTLVSAGALLAVFGMAVPASAQAGSTGPIYGYDATGSYGMCLNAIGAEYGNIANYQEVALWGCTGSAAQQWYFDNDTIHLAAAPGMCLDIYQGGTAEGTPVDLYSCYTNSPAAQVWVPQVGGALRNPQSGMCLDDPGYSQSPYVQMQIWPCKGGANQNWSLP
jgi:Ricin-type beta-trefoil lectin domain